EEISNFITAKTLLSITPTTITFEKSEISENPPFSPSSIGTSDTTLPHQCTVGYVIKMQKQLISGIAAIDSGWTLHFESDFNGLPAGNSVEDILIPTDGSWADGHNVNSVVVTCAQPDQVELRFENHNYFPVRGGNIIGYDNKTKVVLTGWCRTQLGELA